jgi:hypothetical protein
MMDMGRMENRFISITLNGCTFAEYVVKVRTALEAGQTAKSTNLTLIYWCWAHIRVGAAEVHFLHPVSPVG